jgi:hypothetical protein
MVRIVCAILLVPAALWGLFSKSKAEKDLKELKDYGRIYD